MQYECLYVNYVFVHSSYIKSVLSRVWTSMSTRNRYCIGCMMSCKTKNSLFVFATCQHAFLFP